jgi:hypothetical protein
MVMGMVERNFGSGLTRLPLALEAGGRISSGVYFVCVRATGAETGKRLNRVQKMVVVR